MSNQFESQKNARAGTFTGLVIGLLILVFFIVSWTIPTIPPPPIDQGIEVNLGNSDQGLGDIAPQIPGEPSAAEKEVKAPPKTVAVKAEPVKAVETDDNDRSTSGGCSQARSLHAKSAEHSEKRKYKSGKISSSETGSC